MTKKYTKEEIDKIACKKGFKCLSDKYKNNKTKMLWECGNGHQWEACLSYILSGCKCPYCKSDTKWSLEAIQAKAQKRGWECLAKEYKNNRAPMPFKCKFGHEFIAKAVHIMNSTSKCPECSIRKPVTLEDLHKFAEANDGKCLATEYIKSDTLYLWECKHGHVFKMTQESVKAGHWCSTCHGRNRTIEYLHKLAKKNGIECFGTEYKGMSYPYWWKCSLGHKWYTPASYISSGNGCPECALGKSERICRDIFEQLFELKFPKTRPDFLKNSSGNNLELDGYCEELKLAFEYQGIHHYSDENPYTNKKGKADDPFYRIKIHDELKSELCGKNDISLIIIPYWTRDEDLISFIIDECKTSGVKLPDNYELLDIVIRNNIAPENFDKFKQKIEERSGKLITTYYKGMDKKHTIECSEGHRWDTIPNVILRGNWCPECSGNVKLTIEEFQQIAKNRGGRCLSEEYTNLGTKLLFECSENHRFEAVPRTIKHRNSWCPVCAGQRIFIEDIQQFVKEKGGECLSKEYINDKTPLLFSCSKKHTWQTPWGLIRRGSWCPTCVHDEQKLTIEDMQILAANKGGKCLSDNYVTIKHPLLWECSKGHQWQSVADNIKQGCWCPECGGNTTSKKTLDELAEKKGGKCLSDKYIDSKSPLLWQCSKGHQWETKIKNIKRGNWCPICARTSKKK